MGDQVVLLGLGQGDNAGGDCDSCGTGAASCDADRTGGDPGADGAGCGSGGCAGHGGAPTPRAAVLACRDALRAGGAEVRLVEANSDAEIDTVLTETVLADGKLVVVGNDDGEARAVVRRLVRRCAPRPSKRPADLPTDRTLPDLPPIGLLSLDRGGTDDLVARLGLPRDPAEVAAAVLAGRTARFDLLRTDAGSVTLHGALLGGADESGRPVSWRAVVNVDDAVLSDGTDPVLLCTVVNAPGSGYAEVDGLPLVTAADPADGSVDVAVAVLRYVGRRWLGNRRARVEVRRARGRAVAVTPTEDVPFVDDAVTGTLTRKRTWWMERGAWAVYR
ncbi:hypothetical protein Athai_65950 [Actinocatenispora thailandica]|uniref:DAGKc domain-containing protein n=1 Tax=Actinocatenispora thailandica TaxID=227318 RepID=A0A7R7DXA1_9ACTN|nr:diacylglycerol kinase family protein [Actinocatenispora thailandica]BCJ39092.1 hypothetical protein Athai_65950 [Actinocatenispora thailandica]